MLRARDAALPIAVALLAALPFVPSLSGGFLRWDDVSALVETDAWRGFSPANLRWMWTTFHMGPYQPLSWMTYALDHAIWGLVPFGFRLTSLLLHAATAVLLFRLLRVLLDREDAGLPAALGALFFAVHPLRVESVCWITERRDVLSGLFYVLSTLLYVRRAKRGGSIAPCFAVFVAACLSKGWALTLPLTFMILDAWPLRRRAWREKIPFLAASIAVGLVGVAGQRSYGALKDLSQSGLAERAAVSLHGLWFYLGKTLWPSGLSPAYPVPPGFGPRDPSVLAAAAGFSTAAAVAWAARRRAPALAAALAHHVAGLLPVLGLVRFGGFLAADRYSLLSGMGWGALLAAAVAVRPRLAAAAFGVVVALGCRSAALAPSWRDDLSLWARAAALIPGDPVVEANYAAALRAAGRADEAAPHEALALDSDPGNPALRNNRGSWLLSKGRTEEALVHLRRAAALDPGSADVRRNLGLALRAAGDLRGARAELEAAVRLSTAAEPLNDLGLVLVESGRPAEAIPVLRDAGKRAPSWAAPRHNLGNALLALGRLHEAATSYERATRLDPSLQEAWVNGGNALARSGRLQEAVRWYGRALVLEPGDAAARRNLAAVRDALERGRRP